MTHEPRHLRAIRRNEGSGPWLHTPRPQPRPVGWHWLALVAVCAALAGFGLAALIGTVEAFAAGPGFDICSTRKC